MLAYKIRLGHSSFPDGYAGGVGNPIPILEHDFSEMGMGKVGKMGKWTLRDKNVLFPDFFRFFPF